MGIYSAIGSTRLTGIDYKKFENHIFLYYSKCTINANCNLKQFKKSEFLFEILH